MTASLRRHRVLGGITRSRLLGLLRHSQGPLGVRDLATALRLHPNTVREQLDLLIDAGLVHSEAGRPGKRGRPSLRYVVRAEADDPDPDAYRALAGALADQLAQAPDPSPASIDAGERWGRGLVGEPPETIDETEAVERLVGLLDDAGFAPDSPVHPGDPIRLRHCPFDSLARERSEVICGVHLGLMRGILGALGTPLDAVALEPFVAPNLCLAHLGARIDG